MWVGKWVHVGVGVHVCECVRTRPTPFDYNQRSFGNYVNLKWS